MPEGIAVEIENGFATIAPDPGKVNEVLTSLLAVTPAELIEQNTRSGPGIQYVVPEGNAREAGLVDEVSLDAAVLDRADLGYADALQEADPNAHDDHWHQPTVSVEGNVYVAGRDGANGALSGPLHVGGPSDYVVPRHPAAEETIEELRQRIADSTINPADYAPRRGVDVDSRVPLGKATIASVVTDAVQQVTQAAQDAIEKVAAEGGRNYDDGKPDADWTRKALDDYAAKIGLNPKNYGKKDDILAAIRDAEKS